MKKNLTVAAVSSGADAAGKDSNPSQTVRAQLQLRELVLSGELPAGVRIAELSIVERLGMSRTPIRAALVQLEQEGLLVALAHGGYAVASFSEREIADAIELRGSLEGLLARLAAERGAAPVVMGDARAALLEIDELLRRPMLTDEAFSIYVDANERFHARLAEMADSEVIARQLERVNRLPFASPSAFVIAQSSSADSRDMLVVAQSQHWQVLDAIERRESGRAEAIMREHSRIAQRNLRAAVNDRHGHANPERLLGVQLIRRR